MNNRKKNSSILVYLIIIGIFFNVLPVSMATTKDYEDEMELSDNIPFDGISSDIVTQDEMRLKSEHAFGFMVALAHVQRQELAKRGSEVQELQKKEAAYKQEINKIRNNEFYENVLVSAFTTVIVGLVYFAYQNYKNKSLKLKNLAI